ncbi:hypothetical protein D3C74_438410 [compost metagenome]
MPVQEAVDSAYWLPLAAAMYRIAYAAYEITVVSLQGQIQAWTTQSGSNSGWNVSPLPAKRHMPLAYVLPPTARLASCA